MLFFPMNMMENFGIMGIPFGFMFFGLLWAVIRILIFILVVIDILKRDDLDTLEKILWLLVVWFLGIIGAIIYYLLSKRKNIKN
ncbi:PLDc N-terminal domain-containing protein [Methanothermococcus sp.]|uniref:PLDc N-terminal domain-containing protein n=1 Tax=Methanothermococcus sp. TaxID=2614238 RepID=UPI0025F1E018|nr:PLDc N-terminal domain-containing protein [Methanothermococcus sp.]